MCQNDVKSLHNIDFAIENSAFQSTNIVNAKQFMNQCFAYDLNNFSDNVLNNIDILS